MGLRWHAVAVGRALRLGRRCRQLRETISSILDDLSTIVKLISNRRAVPLPRRRAGLIHDFRLRAPPLRCDGNHGFDIPRGPNYGRRAKRRVPVLERVGVAIHVGRRQQATRSPVISPEDRGRRSGDRRKSAMPDTANRRAKGRRSRGPPRKPVCGHRRADWRHRRRRLDRMVPGQMVRLISRSCLSCFFCWARPPAS